MPKCRHRSSIFWGISYQPIFLKVDQCQPHENRGYPTSIIDTYTKPTMDPPKGIWFPANLGLVLTQSTSWDDWRAVYGVDIGPFSKILAVKCYPEDIFSSCKVWKLQSWENFRL